MKEYFQWDDGKECRIDIIIAPGCSKNVSDPLKNLNIYTFQMEQPALEQGLAGEIQ